MGRLPSCVLLVMSLSWSGLATDDCRLEDTSVSVVCVDMVMDQCRHELADQTFQLPRLHLGHNGHWVEGSFTTYARNIKAGNIDTYPGFLLQPRTEMTMTQSFYGKPYLGATISASFNLCPRDPDDNSGCGQMDTAFGFYISKFKKLSSWWAISDKVLYKRASNPNATIELKDHGFLAGSFKNDEFKGWSKEELANVTRKYWTDKVRSSLREMYDGWLESCVFPTLSREVTKAGPPQ